MGKKKIKASKDIVQSIDDETIAASLASTNDEKSSKNDKSSKFKDKKPKSKSKKHDSKKKEEEEEEEERYQSIDDETITASLASTKDEKSSKNDKSSKSKDKKPKSKSKKDDSNKKEEEGEEDPYQRLLKEMDEMKRQHAQEIHEIRTSLEASKEEVEALGFSNRLALPSMQQSSVRKSSSRKDYPQRKWQGVHIPLLPLDTFSYLAFSKIRTKAMLISVLVILVQSATIGVLLFDIFSSGDPSNMIGVPAGASPAVSFIQAMTLLIGVFSQTDFQDSLNTLLIGYHRDDLKSNFGVDVSYFRWFLSLSVRIVISLAGLLATFFLIVTGIEASEILLDFTAIEFITNLDNIFFWLTAWGYLGYSAQTDASKLVQAQQLDLVTIVDEEVVSEEESDDDNETTTTGTTTTTTNLFGSKKVVKSHKKKRLLARRSSSLMGFFRSNHEKYTKLKDHPKQQQQEESASLVDEEGRRYDETFHSSEDDDDDSVFASDDASSSFLKTIKRGMSVGLLGMVPGDRKHDKRKTSATKARKTGTRMSLFLGGALVQSGPRTGDPHQQPLAQKEEDEEPAEYAVQRQCPRFLFLWSVYMALMSGWAVIFFRQKTGRYLCQTVFVQFSDDNSADLAAFTGMYNYQCPNDQVLCNRGEYIEEGHGAFQETARFAFCHEMSMWTFSYKQDHGHPVTPADPCQDWKVKSPPTGKLSESSFDMLRVGNKDWLTLNRIGTKVPMPSFTLQCFDCNLPLFCGGAERGYCVDNRCVCNEGWFGKRCEFREPCQNIEIDPIHPPFQGTRQWSETFRLLGFGSTQIRAYGRPVYISDFVGDPDVIFFTGRRWAISTASALTGRPEATAGRLVDFFHNEFHAMWSDGAISFISSPVDTDSPTDSNSPVGIEWFQAATHRDGNLQSADLNRPVAARFLCSACSDDTNPCIFGGICTEDGTCDCVTGSSGQLCQIPPVGDGRCNPYFNTPEFAYDGGDCCQDTCVSTEEHECGSGVVGTSFGVDAVGFIGYPNCVDPEISARVANSKTLFAIQQRKVVRCGLVRNPEFINNFEMDLCRAIAAAALGDSDAIELVWVLPQDRFVWLRDERFDILFRSDHTANRDVFEKSAESPFNTAPLSYLYTGLSIGGIPPYASCADSLDVSSPECLGLKICVPVGTTWLERIRKLFPTTTLVEVAFLPEAVESLEAGLCNTIAFSNLDIAPSTVGALGFTGDEYEVGQTMFAKSFLSFQTRQDDRVWSQFTSWVLQALVQAEESGVTRETAFLMATSTVFGEGFKYMFRDAVAANGNYGELWERSIPIPRGINSLNDGSTGLIISNQLGAYTDQGPPPIRRGTLRSIMDRGSLSCGIRERLGFATIDEDNGEWDGFEADLCRAIGDSLGVDIEFRPLSTIDRFSALVAGAVDVSFGISHTMEREVKHEGTGGEAFDFSPTYFHDGLTFAGMNIFGECAVNSTFDGNCSPTVICVPYGTTWLDFIRLTLGVPTENVLVSESHEDSIFKLSTGECNAIAGETADISEAALRDTGIELNFDDYHVGTKLLTNEPIAIMSRSDDPQFSDYVRWLVFALIYAEEQGIGRPQASIMPLTNLFGPDLTRCWQRAVMAAGPYSDLWRRNLNGIIERSGRNLLNRIDAPGPQLFANPGTGHVHDDSHHKSSLEEFGEVEADAHKHEDDHEKLEDEAHDDGHEHDKVDDGHGLDDHGHGLDDSHEHDTTTRHHTPPGRR